MSFESAYENVAPRGIGCTYMHARICIHMRVSKIPRPTISPAPPSLYSPRFGRGQACSCYPKIAFFLFFQKTYTKQSVTCCLHLLRHNLWEIFSPFCLVPIFNHAYIHQGKPHISEVSKAIMAGKDRTGPIYERLIGTGEELKRQKAKAVETAAR